MLIEIVVIFILVVMNGVFSMSELAVVSARKGRLKSDADEGQSLARLALELANAPHTFLSTVQIGITVLGIAAGVYGGAKMAETFAVQIRKFSWTEPYADVIAYTLVVGFITYLSLVIGELLPKRLALSYPEQIAKLVSPSMRLMSRVFRPLVSLLEGSTSVLFHMLPFKPAEVSDVTEEEVKLLIAQGRETGSIEKTEEQIMGKVLRLGDRPAVSVMTPRTDLVWVDVAAAPEKIWHEVARTPHSFFPAGQGSFDDVLGVISIKDLALHIMEHKPGGVESLLREAVKVPGSISALRVLERLKETKKQIAIVIDEHGSLGGIITLHDLLEAMVGEISEEEQEPEVVRRADGSFLVDATVDIEELFRLIELPSGAWELSQSYHSLGGFVMAQLGHIPKTAERFMYGGFWFEVVDMDKYRVDKVLVTRV